MPLSTRVSGAWKNLSAVSVKVNGAWKTCDQVYVKVNGVWKSCFQSAFKFTVNTQATASGEKKTSVPFHLYEEPGAKLTVNWGDGTTSTLTDSNYTQFNSSASVHTYSSAGTYTVTVSSNDWSKIYIARSNRYGYTGLVENHNDSTACRYYFERTVTSINSPVPLCKGHVYLSYEDGGIFVDKSSDVYSQEIMADSLFIGCKKLTSIPANLFFNLPNVTSFYATFMYCESLTSIPANLFSNNINATDFYYTFSNCTSLTSITSGLFDKCTKAKDFTDTFARCTSLISIPSGLFDKCTEAKGFETCFYYCTALTSIPTGLFDKCTKVTSFWGTFSRCASLTSIPSGLFDKCTEVVYFYSTFDDCTALGNFTLSIRSTKVTDADDFVVKKSGTTRIVKVPDNSTTKTTFSNEASHLGLTIQNL